MKTFYAIENGKVALVECDSRKEVERLFGYGNVFENNMECLKEIRQRALPKQRKLSESEMKNLIKEQIAYGRSLMSEIDWAIRKESLKSIDAKQREFARQMMKGEQ